MSETHVEQVFLESIIKTLASQPDEVKITRTIDEMGVLYTVSFAKEDIAKIIGRNGSIANSIRNLLKVVGHDNKVRATMKIDAPYINRQAPQEAAAAK